MNSNDKDQDRDDQKVRYPGQLADEVTEKVIYKHIMSIVPFLFAAIVLGIVLVIGFTYLANNPSVLPSGISAAAIGLAGFVFMLLLFLGIVAIVWIWRSNKIVITNQHMVEIDQVGLFNKKVSTLSLSRIQDVSARIHGPLQTILGYGGIDVQTAGEDKNFRFDYIPDPYGLENYILEMHKKFYAADDGLSEDQQAGGSGARPNPTQPESTKPANRVTPAKIGVPADDNDFDVNQTTSQVSKTDAASGDSPKDQAG